MKRKRLLPVSFWQISILQSILLVEELWIVSFLVASLDIISSVLISLRPISSSLSLKINTRKANVECQSENQQNLLKAEVIYVTI